MGKLIDLTWKWLSGLEEETSIAGNLVAWERRKNLRLPCSSCLYIINMRLNRKEERQLESLASIHVIWKILQYDSMWLLSALHVVFCVYISTIKL